MKILDNVVRCYGRIVTGSWIKKIWGCFGAYKQNIIKIRILKNFSQTTELLRQEGVEYENC
ncbi:MAG: hypothetical protein KKD01_00610 [Proteobacteria bacterium]|nr:hypothetical protein [Pseudomonadota bacterium]MBU1417465.1 hypothetical protein [Pseudomonadota bacterium]MBU1453199.1 hypothetical protein [Pseudomonadota bacterium]